MKAQVYHSTKTFSYTAKQPYGDRKLSKQTKISLRYRKTHYKKGFLNYSLIAMYITLI